MKDNQSEPEHVHVYTVFEDGEADMEEGTSVEEDLHASRLDEARRRYQYIITGSDSETGSVKKKRRRERRTRGGRRTGAESGTNTSESFTSSAGLSPISGNVQHVCSPPSCRLASLLCVVETNAHA